ncbi:MAG: histidine phosphatase family protein [Alphaproteobacteria bacterium]|nr:histidine phosphatase family protein [Alphaproteobacteria bacterium]
MIDFCEKRVIIFSKFIICMTMKKTFFVFRHGQTDFNAKNIWQGAKINALLNDVGKQQAVELGDRLVPLGIEIIYSSNMRRAIQTAMIVNQKLDVPMFLSDGLQECNFGIAEGMPMDELQKLYPEEVRAVLYPTPQTWDSRYPGEKSESKHGVFDRVTGALRKIASATNCKIIGISSHGGVISSLLAGLGSYGLPLPNCCIAHIVYDSQKDEFSFVELF